MRARADPLAQAMVDFLEAIAAGDIERRLRAAREASRLAPASAEYSGQVALSSLLANRPREAIAVLSRTDPERGLLLVSDLYWGLLTFARHGLSEYERELREARRGRRQFPSSLLSEYAELRARAALDAPGEFARRVERASLHMERTLYPGGPAMLAAEARLSLAGERRAHGAPEEAKAITRRLAAALTDGSLPDTHEGRDLLARVLYFEGRWDEAWAVALRVAEEHPADVRHVGLLGAIAARRGDRADAARQSATLAASRAPHLFGRASYEHARIAALLGDNASAVALLRASLEQGLEAWNPFAWGRGNVDLHTAIDFERLRDDPAFRELIRPKG
jgi:Flp pilus assembly protein TadD